MEIDLREANQLFHDYESRVYDDKWGICYDRANAQRIKEKFEKVLKGPFPSVDRLLEVGCGTGYVSLNLCLNRGLIREMYACDISPGMVEAYRRNAEQLGIEVETEAAPLERLPYPDGHFDMVLGHAILHHIPEVREALEEIYRVLSPGGICMVAGEPTKMGDRLGRLARDSTGRILEWYVKRGGYFGGLPAKLRSYEPEEEDKTEDVKSLESVVDIHTFDPPGVCSLARSVGFEDARYRSEELLSSFVGWITRTIENRLVEENLTFRWRYWSYQTHLKLSRYDDFLYRFLPSSWFYNMLLYLKKPE